MNFRFEKGQLVNLDGQQYVSLSTSSLLDPIAKPCNIIYLEFESVQSQLIIDAISNLPKGDVLVLDFPDAESIASAAGFCPLQQHGRKPYALRL